MATIKQIKVGSTTYDIKNSPEFIVGTWTAASGTWTGVSSDIALYDGKEIVLYLPFAGSGNATLNLTLAGGETTGAKNVYYQSTTRMTTHYGQYSQVHLIYHSALNINGTNYEGWWSLPGRDTNTNTLLRTYASATNIEVPLIGSSSANSTTAAWSTYTNTYKDWYGAIPNDDAKRAKINLSTGKITVPGGIVIKGNAADVPLLTRGINGSDGSGGAGDLYINHSGGGITYFGTSGGGNISADGKSYSGNAATASTWKTARTLTIGSTGKSVNGSGNVSWTLAEIGAAASDHNHDSVYVNVSGDTMTGNLTISTSAAEYTAKDTSHNGTMYAGWGSGHMNHGVYSSGYAPTATTWTSDGKWLVYRDKSGNVILNGNAATATTATTASKLGSSNVGAADRPIYLSSGTATQTTYRMAATNAAATTAVAITDNLNTGIWYVNGTNSTDLYSQSDGVAFVNKYNDNWIGEIYQDYRTGQLAIRGKNNGTWQAWRKVLDSSNYNTWAAAKSHTHSYLPLSGGTLTGALTISNGADLILKAGSSATTDPGDLLFQNSSGTEIGRIYKQAGQNAFFIRYSSSGTPYKIYTAQEITSGSAAPSGGTSGDIYFQTGTTQDGWTTLWTGALQGSKTQAIAMDGYSKLRIWCCNYSVMYSFLVDLTTTGANTHNTSYPYYGGGTSVIVGSGMEIHGCTVGVNAAKSTLYNEWMGYHKNSGANDRNSNASYYIYKVEGCK